MVILLVTRINKTGTISQDLGYSSGQNEIQDTTNITQREKRIDIFQKKITVDPTFLQVL